MKIGTKIAWFWEFRQESGRGVARHGETKLMLLAGSRCVGVVLSAFFGYWLMSPVQARTVYLGTLNPEQEHSIYYDEDSRAFLGTGDVGLNPTSVTGGDVDSGLSGVRGLDPGVHTPESNGPGLRRSVRVEAAAPITETLLMIVTGLGLVAFQMRRVQRLLHHRPFSA